MGVHPSWVHPSDVILQATFKKSRRFKLLKSRWIDRHYILYKRDRNRELYSIDEYKPENKFQPKKTFFLENILKVVSNLAIPDNHITCAKSSTPNYQWIFSVSFLYNNEVKDLYLVAGSRQEMQSWVNELCHLGSLSKEEDDLVRSHPPSTSYRGVSESSDSIMDSEVPNVDGRYLRLQNMTQRSVSMKRSNARSDQFEPGETSSVSGASSVYSTKRTTTIDDDDDEEEGDSHSCVSTHSNPPIPPRSLRSQNSVRSDRNGTMRNVPVKREAGYERTRKDFQDSSGETIKFELAPRHPSYAESMTSSEGANTFYTNTSSLNFDAPPPPVDRTKKPASLMLNEERRMIKKRYNSLNRTGNNGGQQRLYSSYSRTMTRDISSGPRKKIDYFEPHSINIGSSSTQSPVASDIEYISVDVDRTMAFKQMREPV